MVTDITIRKTTAIGGLVCLTCLVGIVYIHFTRLNTPIIKLILEALEATCVFSALIVIIAGWYKDIFPAK